MLQVDAVKKQKVGELDAIDGAETVELKDAGNGIGVFDLGEPGVGDMELGITFGVGDLLAEIGDFTCGDAQTETNGFELFAGGLRPSHVEVYLRTVKGRIYNIHGIFFCGYSPHSWVTAKTGSRRYGKMCSATWKAGRCCRSCWADAGGRQDGV